MTWAKLDDRANEHEKQLAAGPKACWLWACGLMYVNRQPRKTGRIPKAVVSILYPGLGPVEAKKLVAVGLWHDAGDAYEVHDFHGWNPELRQARAEAGRQGGKRSGEARREAKAKQLASENGTKIEAENESKDEARDQTRVGSGSTPPHPTPKIQPAAVSQDLAGIARESGPTVAATAPGGTEPESDDGPPSRETDRPPRSLEEALKLEPCVRACAAVANPHDARYLQPHQWPEVQAINAELARAAGLEPRILGTWDRDPGVRKVVELLADGNAPRALLEAARRLPMEPIWKRADRPGLHLLSPTVVGLTLQHAASEDNRSEVGRDLLRKADQALERQRTGRVRGQDPDQGPSPVGDLVAAIVVGRPT